MSGERVAWMTVDEWVGFVGVFFLLLAYLLNLIGALSRESIVYHGLNALGAAVAGYASYRIGFFPFVLLEGVWTLASVGALCRAAAHSFS
jgi:hypothetical protein